MSRDLPQAQWTGITRIIDQNAWHDLTRHAQRVCGDRDVAEDVVQTVLVRTFQWWRNGNHNESEILPYCHTAVHNEAVKATIRHRQLVMLDHASNQLVASSDPELDLIFNEACDALMMAVPSLPERCRQCFIMVRVLDTPRATVAEKLGIKPKTVDNHVARAGRILRERMSAWFAADHSTQSIRTQRERERERERAAN